MQDLCRQKPGKLPETKSGIRTGIRKNATKSTLDAFEKGTKVLIVDDLLATGGTANAGAVVEIGAGVYELAAR